MVYKFGQDFFWRGGVQSRTGSKFDVKLQRVCGERAQRARVPGTLASDRSQVVSLSKNQPGEYIQPVKCELCPAAGDCKACLITGSAARLHPHSETFKFTQARTEEQRSPRARLVLGTDKMCKGGKMSCLFLLNSVKYFGI